MEKEIAIGVLALLNIVAGGVIAIWKFRESNNVKSLATRVTDLENEKAENKKLVSLLQTQNAELQRQNNLLRNEVRSMTAMLRRYEQASRESLIVVTELGIVVEWDSAATLMFGFSADEAVGREISSLIVPPDIRQQHRFGMANVYRNHRPPRTAPLKQKASTKSGELIDVEIQLLPGWEADDNSGWRYGARIRKVAMDSTRPGT